VDNNAVGFLKSFKKLFARQKSNLKRINVGKRFQMIGRTGQGSMSKVWRARDNELGRVVCVKILDKVKTARFDARFVGLQKPLEGAVLMGLRHKNIVQTFEYGLTEFGEQYVVMELLEGVGLNFLIEGKIVDVLAQICDAIEYVHKAGYLHRDICPRNVMMTNQGLVKLIDFGLTVPYRPEFCKPGNRTGTPNYLAPEIIKRTTTDNRVDLFALGVSAYEMITGGRLPWEKAESMEMLLSHINAPGRDPREHRPDLDPRVAELLMKSIERNPADRFQSAAEFRDALLALPKKL
jgi:eukaryotic-like serine/threonine-protein kinase